MSWHKISPCDERAFNLYCRHYSKSSSYKNSRKTNVRTRKITGPGQSIVLLTEDEKALFVWHYNSVKRWDKQTGVNCSIFRNESKYLSSFLILEAEKWVLEKWPECERLFTYVDSGKIKSENPGFCFKKAGWKPCGISKVNKLHILEKAVLALDRAVNETEGICQKT